ncbi:MAG: phage Gp37/Gp68 family protein, partial [Candidatus Pacebacteria bacterium]|nr:phage Gp37/Gp68 family protein [Candidatus Paceibacterota bacterium]
WANKVWNPITGCSPVSEGCQNCYADRMSKRLKGRCGYSKTDPFQITYHDDKLGDPLHWKKPSRIFVCSMGDLFHESIDEGYLCRVFDVMVHANKHIFMVLTKRPERMKKFFDKCIHGKPAPNIWLGVTTENQQRADERIPILLQTPAVVRFVSVEPILRDIELYDYLPMYDFRPTYDYYQAMYPELGNKPILLTPGIDWVICGGETGQRARPAQQEWIRSIYTLTRVAGVPFFFKKWGTSTKISNNEKYKVIEECREFPEFEFRTSK